MFNVSRHNGINLNRSVKNPNSNTAKIVRYVGTERATYGWRVTKREIMVDVFGKVPTMKGNWSVFRVGRWGSNLFAALCEANILVKSREGRTTFYTLGANASVVKL